MWHLSGILGFCSLAVAVQATFAGDITIRDIDRERSTGWSFVDNGWSDNAELMLVQFALANPHPGTLPVKGYFFNEAKELVYRFDGAPKVQVKTKEYQTALSNLKAGTRHEVAFPVPPSVSGPGPLRWKTFVAEIGSGDQIARMAYPATGNDTATFDYSQKPVRSLDQAAAGEAGGGSAITVKPTIKSISRFKNALNGRINNDWVRGLNTLKVKIRLESGSAAGGFFVRAYFFDKDKMSVLKYTNPPQVEIGGGKYASLPPVWKDGETYEVYFPIPDDKDRGSAGWKTAIVVFGNNSAVAADSYPSTGVRISDFDFPERLSVDQASSSAQ